MGLPILHFFMLLLLFPFLYLSPCLGAPTNWYFEEASQEVIDFLLAGLQPRTRALYRREYDRFITTTEVADEWRRMSHDQRDALVAQYLVRGYAHTGSERVSRTQAGYLVSFLRYHDAQNRYGLSHRVCGVWRARVPPDSAWPLTGEACEALAGILKVAQEVPAAVCVLLMFTGLLRVGEALGLQWNHVYIPDDVDRGEGAIYLPTSKTGPNQYIPITSAKMLLILKRFKQWSRSSSPSSKVFPYTYGAFRLIFLAAVAVLALPIGVYRTHSLRRGGATSLVQQTRSPEYVAVIGRWKNLGSCRRYLRQGEALVARIMATSTTKVHARLVALRMDVDELFGA
jgi:integrase